MSAEPGGLERSEAPDLTLLLNRMREGDREAGNQAVALVYHELHRIASREMRREREGHLLQTTALVNEAYLRLLGSQSITIQDRGHFFALASKQMRRILIDHARSQGAQRRGGRAVQVDIDRMPLPSGTKSIDLLLLNESLEELERLDPRAAQIVELRYFGGYTDQEVVEAVGASLSTVRRDWEFARTWLFDRMRDDQRDGKDA
jgi:RNA polymerase sigma-70 factor, ECF subfamily